ncbi:MAG: response regulator transcription factor [Bacteroidota bacterium]
MKKIAFIEDNATYLRSLQEAVHLNPNVVCLIAERSMEAFMKKVPKRATIDLLFVDIALPGISGIEALPKLRKRFPNAQITMLTQNEDPKLLMKSLSSGANGYLLKDFKLSQLSGHIKTISEGGAIISPKMALYLVKHFQPKSINSKKINLGKKEIQLLKLFANGLSYEEASEVLNISVNGVKYYVKKIYNKLGVDNKIDAIRIYQQQAVA